MLNSFQHLFRIEFRNKFGTTQPNGHAEFISASIYIEIPKQVRNDEKLNRHAEFVSTSII